MNFDLSADQIQIRDAVRELCASEFAPHAARWDREGDVPASALDTLAGQGFLGMSIPEEWGGVGYDARTIALVIEEIARVSAALAIMIAVHNSVGALPVFRFGTDAQRRRYLPRLVSKELAAFSLSEPGTGSDAGAVKTTAERYDGHYLLNGSKNWVTNGARAGIYLVFARTDRAAGNRGLTAFLVERGAIGLVIGKAEDKMGLRGSDTVAACARERASAGRPAARRRGRGLQDRDEHARRRPDRRRRPGAGRVRAPRSTRPCATRSSGRRSASRWPRSSPCSSSWPRWSAGSSARGS